jgi:nucleoside-diphosphate-sugar epimerase
MRLLVTGASGFLGRNLLLSLGGAADVTAVYASSSGFPAFLRSAGLEQVRAVQADLTTADGADAVAAAGPFEACVFLAANGDPARSVERPAWDLASNCASLVNLLERCALPTLVFFSSGAVYDGIHGDVSPRTPARPRLPYAVSKLAAEHYVEHFRARGRVERAAVVRFFGAYGPHEPARKVYTKLVRRFGLEGDRRFTIRGDGRNLIDAMYVSDAMRAIRLLLAAPPPPDETVLDLCSGQPLTLTDLVRRAAAAFGLEPEIAYEGEVPEHIEFRSRDRTMAQRYGFTPAVGLEAGLGLLRDHLRTAS